MYFGPKLAITTITAHATVAANHRNYQ